MTETQISCFMATAETKSVTKASEIIFRSPQAISKHIAHLEEELGCELFERSSKGVVLTPIGEEYYTYFRTNHNQLKHTLNTIHYMYDVMRLQFRIAMESSLACVWNKRNENPLIREFADFLKKFYKNI